MPSLVQQNSFSGYHLLHFGRMNCAIEKKMNGISVLGYGGMVQRVA